MATAFPVSLEAVLNRDAQEVTDENDETFNVRVQDQVKELGDDPSLIQAVTVLLQQSARAEYEARKTRLAHEKEFVEVVKVVKENHDNIVQLKSRTEKTEKAYVDIHEAQSKAESRLSQLEYYMNKSYYLACETRQKNSKGNFILSGRHIPRQRGGENILNITQEIVFRKYGISIHPNEFKVIHRLAGDRILFALHSRLPGMAFHQLVSKMNSNPYPELETYVSIQLFEPYNDLFYIARRLKFYKVISYYRLDENGHTHIALNENCRAFEFSYVDQLR